MLALDTEWTLLGLGHGTEGRAECIRSGLSLLEWWRCNLLVTQARGTISLLQGHWCMFVASSMVRYACKAFGGGGFLVVTPILVSSGVVCS